MGRHAGWIAVYSGHRRRRRRHPHPRAPVQHRQACASTSSTATSGGATFSIVVVAEGATPEDGGLLTAAPDDRRVRPRPPRRDRASSSSGRSRSAPGFESRITILGHVQRGGTPLAFDRVLGSRFGVSAVDAITEGDYGKMVALRGTRIERVPLAEALAEPKLVDAELYETAAVFFG